MKNLGYSEILESNKQLGRNLRSHIYNITILSNGTVSLIRDILEYSLRTDGVNANVKIGDYDNIVQNALTYEDSNLIIIFWELCNIIDGLQYTIELFTEEQVADIFVKTTSEIDLVLRNLKETSLVLINEFTALPFLNSHFRIRNLETLAIRLNQYLENNLPNNVKLVDLNRIIADVGLKQSIDLRYYYSSKALYTINFFKAYTEYIKPFIMSVNGKSKKAIIFDCDNTLWKGILGEDGIENIEMSSKTKDGAIFAEVQSIATALSKQGTLIGLCTKNNPEDVDEVIKHHPDMQLRDEHITIKKVNWSDKAANLKEIARDLNIGLNSLVFVDDSPFEINLIRQQLPEIMALQVPERLCDYPNMIRENAGLFYNMSLTEEDRNRVEMYREQIGREKAQKEFASLDDYLASLQLRITIFEDDETMIPRISQMSQKTNQFNLTTKRYTEGDIRRLIGSDVAKVYAFSLSDKFGDSGVTGLVIINLDPGGRTADIDTFLMSCRVIGRNVEYAFMDYLMASLKESGAHVVTAKYIKTRKNGLTKDFYDRCGLSLIEQSGVVRNYSLEINQYQAKRVNYIEVINGKENKASYVASV